MVPACELETNSDHDVETCVSGFCVPNSFVRVSLSTILRTVFGLYLQNTKQLNVRQTLTNQDFGFGSDVWMATLLIDRSANRYEEK